MRDRLVKLLQENSYLDVLNDEHWLLAAEQLLANGVVVIDTDVVSLPNRPLISQYMGRPIDEVINLIRNSEWISVDERLPEPDGIIRKWGELRIQPSVRVLCACKQKSGKVFVKEGHCELWGSRVVWRIPGNIDVVTHWMPLPEATKMKGGAE
jgi:hypothetical protein